MRIRRPDNPRRSENTIALINIVFLMLIFFLIAGTLAPPLDSTVSLISSEGKKPSEPPDTLTVRSDGSLFHRGEPTSVSDHLAALRQDGPEAHLQVRLVPDRELPAARLIEVAAELRRAGAASVLVVTERTLP